MASVTMKQTDFILKQAVQLKGTKFWGKVRMIETDPETGEQTRIYVQLLQRGITMKLLDLKQRSLTTNLFHACLMK